MPTDQLTRRIDPSPTPHRKIDPPRKPVVVVVIPAFNEDRFIASVVITTLQYVEHVIVVDDGSTDRTADLAEAAGAQVIRQDENMGKAEALNAGFRSARRLNPDVVVCLDGDAQHDPAEVDVLARPVLEGDADVVIGSRFLDVKSEIPRWRQVGQHTLTAVTNTLSGVKVTDSQSGYRAFSPAALETMRFRTGGLSLESEMQFLIEAAGLRVAEVPISVKYLDGNKRNPIVHGLQVLDAMLSLVARRRPLLFISLPGVMVWLAGLVMGLYVTIAFNETGALMVGYTVLTALLIITGLLISLTGLLLHSLGHFTTRILTEIEDVLVRERARGPDDAPPVGEQRS